MNVADLKDALRLRERAELALLAGAPLLCATSADWDYESGDPRAQALDLLAEDADVKSWQRGWLATREAEIESETADEDGRRIALFREQGKRLVAPYRLALELRQLVDRASAKDPELDLNTVQELAFE